MEIDKPCFLFYEDGAVVECDPKNTDALGRCPGWDFCNMGRESPVYIHEQKAKLTKIIKRHL